MLLVQYTWAGFMTLTREREDYLKTIYQLEQAETPVRTNSIAKAMQVMPASVTGVITQLAKLSYLEHQPYKGVTLTNEGRSAALKIIRRHRLIELYLIKHLNYSWDEVHDEAERLEHAVSQRFIDRIEAILGHPDSDPHGAPIPTRDGYVRPRTDVALSELHSGQSGLVSEVLDNDPTLLRFLAEQGVVIGAEIFVQNAVHQTDAILIQLNQGAPCEISLKDAQTVFVQVIDS